MTREEICNEYEKETGNVIIEEFMGRNPIHCPGIIVNDHGPLHGEKMQMRLYTMQWF